jgi:DNA polymerase
MTQHMPRGYWRNLPEASLIQPLIGAAGARATAMVEAPPTAPSLRARRARAAPATQERPDGAEPTGLDDLAKSLQACRRCALHANATQAVAGEGAAASRLMLVGEQPGDVEDLRGRPFVGPAGQLLDKALAEAGIARDRCRVTNAVKHFKFELRGKRRIHKSPAAGEVAACRWWLRHEMRLVDPEVVVAMGSTAAAAVLGRTVSVLSERGLAGTTDGGAKVVVTVHPSYLLRLPDDLARRQAYRDFVAELALAARLTKT